ncbi:uncharacterized protein BDR25DRAFT_394570 [Lindgomyces ingoldianus]|uniref:Uncharacterized protein n=1 Tax=Lindgomyces ingoldianus TaxID=673940 RepID=A0ACB6QQA2_9PLEO|nr:uncharacterized protein BDR25DRAFT_394570 [Lindgomyces ingoldianus]KAF2468715.1 hypothetical protein BDR25DRAFT_394570 [Lindgomyces ingoldianus]
MSPTTEPTTNSSPFYIPINVSKTALLLSDVQTQILARFPKETQDAYLANVQRLLDFFRGEITAARGRSSADGSELFDGIPLIIHHTLPFGVNGNAFVSPSKKRDYLPYVDHSHISTANALYRISIPASPYICISLTLVQSTTSNPHSPNYAIPTSLTPPGGWGTKEEIVLGKLQPNCFASSDLLKYLHARGIRHIVLIGLTTMGNLDFHIICPREVIIDDDPEVDELLMTRVLPKFVDVCGVGDVLALSLSTPSRQK